MSRLMFKVETNSTGGT